MVLLDVTNVESVMALMPALTVTTFHTEELCMIVVVFVAVEIHALTALVYSMAPIAETSVEHAMVSMHVWTVLESHLVAEPTTGVASAVAAMHALIASESPTDLELLMHVVCVGGVVS